MIRSLCAALLMLSGLASLARAADDAPPMPPPAESAMPPPTESAPPAAGTRPVVSAGELAEEAPVPRPSDLSYGVAMRLRWISVPAWLLNTFTKKNVPLSSWGTGIELFRRKSNFDLVGSFAYQNMSPPDGNWLGKNKDAATETDYVQFSGLSLWSFDLSFIWHTMFNEWFGMHYGAGVGIGIVAGDILRTSNDPAACNEMNAGNVNACHPVGALPNGSGGVTLLPQTLQPGPDDPNNPHRFADPNVPPVLPILNMVIGIDFRLPQVRGWEAKIEGGFYDAFFLGGGVAYTF